MKVNCNILHHFQYAYENKAWYNFTLFNSLQPPPPLFYMEENVLVRKTTIPLSPDLLRGLYFLFSWETLYLFPSLKETPQADFHDAHDLRDLHEEETSLIQQPS